MGASDNSSRYSYLAVQKLQQYGHPVVALGKKKTEVLGVSVATEKLPFEDIDTVTLYLNPDNQKEYYDYILSLRPKRVIFNPGTENPDFYRMLEQNNIGYEVACTLVLLGTNQF